MTASAADAEDLAQETMLRALERPPSDPSDIRPWLTKVALNLARDRLRRRKRAPYTGPWLPSPIAIDPEIEGEPAIEAPSSEGRYDLYESASLAFLLALEALTPMQRAVLLLCDVFDYSVREAAELLDASEANVKTTHHRARKRLEAYEGARVRGANRRARSEKQLAALGRFFGAALAEDAESARAVLHEEARALSDGGGEFFAALRPVTGRERVAALFVGLLRKQRGRDFRVAVRELNGAPALVAEQDAAGNPRIATRFVVQCDVDAAGQITALYVVLASAKLTALARSPL
jgi:RNA polymerase sigma-70 factor (ECF subfamily)